MKTLNGSTDDLGAQRNEGTISRKESGINMPSRISMDADYETGLNYPVAQVSGRKPSENTTSRGQATSLWLGMSEQSSIQDNAFVGDQGFPTGLYEQNPPTANLSSYPTKADDSGAYAPSLSQYQQGHFPAAVPTFREAQVEEGINKEGQFEQEVPRPCYDTNLRY